MDDRKEILSIDVEKVIAGKAGDKAKFVPGFIINYLKRIVHQDEINYYLRQYSDKEGVEFAQSVLKEMNIGYNVHNDTLADLSKRYIFVSNHPLGGLDGMVLISYLGEKFKSIRFVVNDLLMHIKPLEPIFVPINKHGRMRQDNAKRINDAYSSDTQILNFPAGLCSRKMKGEITDLEWKKSFISKAIEYERDIVPLFFSGKNSNFFYRLANLRKRLGIKFNVEMIYLPDEMFKQNSTTFDIYMGEPISYKELNDGRSAAEWTKIIRDKCYALKP